MSLRIRTKINIPALNFALQKFVGQGCSHFTVSLIVCVTLVVHRVSLFSTERNAAAGVGVPQVDTTQICHSP